MCVPRKLSENLATRQIPTLQRAMTAFKLFLLLLCCQTINANNSTTTSSPQAATVSHLAVLLAASYLPHSRITFISMLLRIPLLCLSLKVNLHQRPTPQPHKQQRQQLWLSRRPARLLLLHELLLLLRLLFLVVLFVGRNLASVSSKTASDAFCSTQNG